MIKLSKISFFLSVVFLSVVFSFPLFSKAVIIGGVEYNNLRGWAWSDNIGWVSFSCHGSEAAALGIPGEVVNCANSWGAHIVMQSESSALNIPAKMVLGHAWSDDVGWISFDKSETGNPPTTGNSAFDSQFSTSSYLAKFDANSDRIIGWARVLSACTSVPCTSLIDLGFDGWIQFPDISSGLTLYIDGTWDGFVWGGDVVGWIDFSSIGIAYIGDPINTILSNTPPIASAVISPSILQLTGGGFQYSVNVDGSGSYDSDLGETATLNYLWNWGDGTTSTGVITSHTYSLDGIYTISLTITDLFGASSNISQVVSFINPSAGVCLITCTTDQQCPVNSICFIPGGALDGFCVANNLATAIIPSLPPTADTQALAPYECSLSSKQQNVLSVCSPQALSSLFQCGKNSLIGPFCIGPELEACPSSGTCANGSSCILNGTACEVSITPIVYNCVEETTSTTSGRILDSYTAPKGIPPMPIGLQVNGEACTKPTPSSPNNCEGINGCIYANFSSNGVSQFINIASGTIGTANCASDSSLELTGCIYYGAGDLKVNACSLKYPTGCVYYNNGLTNCLPSKSFAGIPVGCKVVTRGSDTMVDCSLLTSGIEDDCIFKSDGSILCIKSTASPAIKNRCEYFPNGAVSCYDIPAAVTSPINFVGCVATNLPVGPLLPPQTPCGSDGTCANQGDVCINGTCTNICSTGATASCEIGQTCLTPCPPDQIWNSTINACELSSWATLPECSGAYVKETLASAPQSPFLNLPTGTTSAYIGLTTGVNANCKYSTNPLDLYASPTMLNFNLTGVLSHETLVAGLFPLPDVNNFLVRCQDSATGVELSACKISLKVGTPCSSNLNCSMDQFCNLATNYCEFPACSGAIPTVGTVLPIGTTGTNIGLTSDVTSICKYNSTLYDSLGNPVNFTTMANTFGTADNLIHSSAVSGLVTGFNAYYVQCQDLNTNVKTGKQDLSSFCQIAFKVGISSPNSSVICAPGSICPNGAICPASGVCTNTPVCPIGSVWNPITNSCNPSCAPGSICPNGSICPANGICPACLSGTIFNPITNTCDLLTTCIPGNICPDNSICPINGVCIPPGACPSGTTFNQLTGICESGTGFVSPLAGEVCNVLGIKFQGTAPGHGIGPTANCSILAVILALLQWFVWFVALFAVVYGLRGGYTYITSAGDNTKLELARHYIMYTVVGVIVAILSFSIIAIARSIAGI
ncbi:MAG: PKD domain-containing protein [Patescibacteria group bacterium]